MPERGHPLPQVHPVGQVPGVCRHVPAQHERGPEPRGGHPGPGPQHRPPDAGVHLQRTLPADRQHGGPPARRGQVRADPAQVCVRAVAEQDGQHEQLSGSADLVRYTQRQPATESLFGLHSHKSHQDHVQSFMEV